MPGLLRKTPRAADHCIGNADGRDEDAARRMMEHFGREQGGDRFVNGFLVVKRLAHAHEDDVSHACGSSVRMRSPASTT